MKTLGDFLKLNKAKKGEAHTHTRMGHKSSGIFGGSYNISKENEDNFYRLYYDHVILNKKCEYLTEKQLDNGTLAIDFDFRFEPSVNVRLYTEKMVQNIIKLICDLMNGKYYDYSEPLSVYIMEREKCYYDAERDKVKDGIHLIFGLKMNKKTKEILRTEIIANPVFKEIMDELPLTNTLNEVVDEGVIKNNSNWMLYGSRKPNLEPYKLTAKYNAYLNNDDGEIHFDGEDISVMTFDLFKELVARNDDRPNANNIIIQETQTTEDIIRHNNSNKVNIDSKEIVRYINIGLKHEIFKLLDGYNTWINIGYIIANELGENGEEIFIELSKQYPNFVSEEDVKTQYERILRSKSQDKKTKKLTIATLIKYFKDADKEKAKIIIKEFKNVGKTKIFEMPEIDDDLKPLFKEVEKAVKLKTETQLAELFIYLTGNIYKCVDGKAKSFYIYENNIWKQTDGGHQVRNNITLELTKALEVYKSYYNDILEQIDNTFTVYDEVVKKTNSIEDLIVCIGKTSWKTNILTELCSLTYDDEFEKIINRKKNYLPVKNGLFNMIENKLEPRKKEDLFTYNCNVNYIPYDETDENFKFIENYMDALFCNNRDTTNCVIDLLKSYASGNTLRFITFMTGEGFNGKSVFIKLIQETFTGCVDTIDKKVIVKTKGQEANCNTHIGKLDKNRIGLLSELTNTDELNDITVKQITGGDAINYRGLYKTDATINPTINLLCATNNMMKFNGFDKAVIARLILVPFNNVFPLDDRYKNKILSMCDYFFSYIMNKGTIRDKFILSDEMKLATKDYLNDNLDPLKEFIDTRLVKCENDKENKPIKMEEFRMQYNRWIKENGYALDARTKTSFTKALNRYNVETKESNSIRKLYLVKWRPEEDDEDETD